MSKATLWKSWLRNMGQASERDKAEAKAWFEELYQAGQEGRYLYTHPGGAPLSYDERLVLQAGIKDRDRGR